MEVGVSNPLTITIFQRFHLSRTQHRRQLFQGHGHEMRTHIYVVQGQVAERMAMRIGDGEEMLQEFLWVGPPPDRQEINKLNEKPSMPSACFVNRFDNLAEPGDVTLVT